MFYFSGTKLSKVHTICRAKWNICQAFGGGGITSHQKLIGFAHTCHDNKKKGIFKLKPVSSKIQSIMRMIQAAE